MRKRKAETPEQSPPVTHKPCKSAATTTKMVETVTATPTLPQKTALSTPMTMEVDSKTEETSSLDEKFFVEDASDKVLTWSATPQKIKPHHIITGNIYPNDWGKGKTLSGAIKKWYKESNSEQKVLAAYCSQSTNAVKTSCIVEAIDFSINSAIKEEDIEELNPVSPWITVNVKDSDKAKALIKYRAVMTLEGGDLVTFWPITNR